MIHTVAPGDTLFSISRRYNISPEQIISWNSLSAAGTLSIGQSLKVADTAATGNSYTVKPGDTLFSIASQFKVSPQAIQTANNLSTANLSVGQVLNIPTAGSTTPIPPPSTVSVSGSLSNIRQIIKVNQRNFSFPHPMTGAMVNTPNFFERAAATKPSVIGIGYAGGNSPVNLDIAAYMRAGLSSSQAQMLKEVSKHEGCFDAINTYDKAIFSFGFIQFAGNVSGSRLPILLNRIKTEEPNLFNELFKKFGIDINGNIISVIDSKNITRTDVAAYEALQADRQLAGIWARAGYHTRVAEIQIEAANEFYVQPALTKIKIDLALGGTISRGIPITDIIRSQAGQAALIDITVNQWIVSAGTYFKYAIENVSKRNGLNSLQAIQNIDERQVLQEIVQLATQYAASPSSSIPAFQRPDACQRVVKRVGGLLSSALSFAK
jgi:LysM repeat protein